MKIAILAQGESVKSFINDPIRQKFDEVWGLNQQAAWKGIKLDKLFVMDDLKLRMPFYAGYDFVNWLKDYKQPIITSRAYPEWPTSEDYPIKEVCQYFGVPTGIAMYSTPDYMIALAVMRGATEIHLFGVDMVDKTMHEMRIGTSHWIGVAHARGVLVRTYFGSMFQYLTNPGHCMECGMYGYAKLPRIEDLVNPEYFEAYANEGG
jgi:hypothetical protein